MTLAADATSTIRNLSDTIDAVSTLRSKLGAISNRLDHAYNNLANIAGNTQAGTAMLKQTNSMASMVMALLR